MTDRYSGNAIGALPRRSSENNHASPTFPMTHHAPPITPREHLSRRADRAAAPPHPRRAEPRSFRALVKAGRTVRLTSRPIRPLQSPHDVRLTIAYAGLCRTDVYAAEGLIPCADPLVLGHEFSAIVDEVGLAVRHVAPGDRVAVFPWIGCDACDACAADMPHQCPHAQMLGIDRDGAFAQSITLPDRAVFPIPDRLSLKLAAYAEPVAAALAVLNADIHRDQRGIVLGAGRIADLTRLILHHHAFRNVVYAERAPDDEHFDFAIETRADDLEPLCRALRPGGLLVVKSRPAGPSRFPHALAVRKELRLHAVHYGSFRDALELLPALAPELDTFIGTAVPLDDFQRLFALEERTEDHKLMFELAGEG